MLQYLNYIILDAARMEAKIESAKQVNPNFVSLYKGESERDLAGVAPYLFEFNTESLFSSWIGEVGWGDSWGIFFRTALPTEEVQKHFRKFLMVQTEDKEELYFRFYDPRVLRIFLPTCDRNQILEIFGRIDYFLVESEDPEWAIKFWQENGELRQSKVERADLIFPPFDIELFNEKTKFNDDDDEIYVQEALAQQKKNESAKSSEEPEIKSFPKTDSNVNITNVNTVEEKSTQSKGEEKNEGPSLKNSKWNLFD